MEDTYWAGFYEKHLIGMWLSSFLVLSSLAWLEQSAMVRIAELTSAVTSECDGNSSRKESHDISSSDGGFTELPGFSSGADLLNCQLPISMAITTPLWSQNSQISPRVEHAVWFGNCHLMFLKCGDTLDKGPVVYPFARWNPMMWKISPRGLESFLVLKIFFISALFYQM